MERGYKNKASKVLDLACGIEHVFWLIEPYLPVQFMGLRTREIDTINDYERATEWVRNGFC